MLAAFNLAICLLLDVFAIGRDALRDNESNYKATQKAVKAMATQHALHTPIFWALAVCFTAYYGAVSWLLSMPSNIAKEVAPIAAGVI